MGVGLSVGWGRGVGASIGVDFTVGTTVGADVAIWSTCVGTGVSVGCTSLVALVVSVVLLCRLVALAIIAQMKNNPRAMATMIQKISLDRRGGLFIGGGGTCR